MHHDLQQLLILQTRDTALLAANLKLTAVLDQIARLDADLAQARQATAEARVSLAATIKLREEVESKVESLRVLQERRRQRAESVRTARELQALSSELDLARAGLLREEAEWFRVSEQVTARENALKEHEERRAALEADQTTGRVELESLRREAEAARDEAQAARQAATGELSRPLLVRYDRLWGARSAEVVVAIRGDACGSCFTSIPMSRRNQIKAGTVLDSCEACGAILYCGDNGA